MRNMEYLQCIFRHRRAFRFVAEKLLKGGERDAMLWRAQWHDLDKAFLYTLMEEAGASEYHRQASPHHLQPCSMCSGHGDGDLLEAVINWECAGYTKPGKPRNAYDTMKMLFPHTEGQVLPIMERLGIARSYQNTPDDPAWLEYGKAVPEAMEDEILKSIYQWIMAFPQDAKHLYQFADNVRRGVACATLQVLFTGRGL